GKEIRERVRTLEATAGPKAPADIAVGSARVQVAVTPDGKTAFVANYGNGTVSTIDVKTRTKSPADIAVGTGPFGVAITPDGKTSIVTNNASGTVSSIDVKTRTKNPADIPVGNYPKGVAITPDGKTAFVTLANLAAGSEPGANSVATIEVKTGTKTPPISLSAGPRSGCGLHRTARQPSSPATRWR